MNDQIETLLETIAQLYQLNKTAEAIHFCDELLKHAPNHYEVLLLKGLSLAKQNKPAQAKPILKRLADRDKQDARPIMGLGFLYEETGAIKKASQMFAAAIRRDPQNTDAHFHRVLTFERLNKLDDAEKAYEEGIKHVGEIPGLLYMGALIKRRAKKHEEAVEILNKISDTVEDEYLANKNFELTQNYDRLKNYDKAFSALEKAQKHRKNFLSRQGYRDESASYRGILDGYADYLNAKPSKNTASLKYQGENLCFFIGFPRSGTTLAQQMMQAHPEIETLEEKTVISELCEQYLIEHNNDFGQLKNLDAATIEKYQKFYHDGVKPFVQNHDYKILVDKMPLTMGHLPLVLTIFPKAKILVSLRHPCDCILSCVMQNFEPNGAMMNLTNLKDGARLYDKVFSIYEKSQNIYDFDHHSYRYEDIIVDSETELKKICAFIGLDWHADMMDYREKVVEKQEVIATPSFRQVTEPLHTKAKGRWKNYEQHFTEILPVVKPYIEKFGYSE